MVSSPPRLAMPPRWLDKSSLARDQDLRRLQLRWAGDDLWMRRGVFILTAAVLLAAVIALALEPAVVPKLAAIAIVGGSVARYYFGRRR